MFKETVIDHTHTGDGNPEEGPKFNSDKDVGDFLLKKYGDTITSIQAFNPDEVRLGLVPLSTIKKSLENRVRGDMELALLQRAGEFLSSPIIKDKFGNDRQARQNFQKSISQAGQTETFVNFFKRNRLKPQNMRIILQFIDLIPQLGGESLPPHIANTAKEIAGKINPVSEDKNVIYEGYSGMTEEEKDEMVKEVDKLALDILIYFSSLPDKSESIS